MEAIGIKDPGKTKIKELAASTQYFEKTETVGRYHVALPWLEGLNKRLLSNYPVADRCLRTVKSDLLCTGCLKKYNSLFKQWEDENMIGEVPTSELNNLGHYLPNRTVIKLSITITPIRPVCLLVLPIQKANHLLTTVWTRVQTSLNLSILSCLDSVSKTLE